ncbi:hypothetical protein [Dyella sp.]|uniref:hypothetical protein n=1 Tax=Dyella sp. TaxID=1869338 RepID=UPI00284D067F|nr:hypothetical protein [Dyella sp.]MDR3446660.1 hypothetical protein [Dyella sp.]
MIDTHDSIRQMTALAALNKMLKQGHFSICTVREIATMYGITADPEAMAILQPLHCVNYADMPRELYATLPALIQKALSGDQVFQFELKRGPEPIALSLGELQKRGVFKRLLGVA